MADRGLGDTVSKITMWLGAKPCAACAKRIEKLNKMFRYKDGTNDKPRRTN
jgi:hypothetical protein